MIKISKIMIFFSFWIINQFIWKFFHFFNKINEIRITRFFLKWINKSIFNEKYLIWIKQIFRSILDLIINKIKIFIFNFFTKIFLKYCKNDLSKNPCIFNYKSSSFNFFNWVGSDPFKNKSPISWFEHSMNQWYSFNHDAAFVFVCILLLRFWPIKHIVYLT